MKITYGGITISIGGRDSPDNLVVETEWDVQVERILRSKNPKVFDRGNGANSVSFTLRQGFADARGAHERILYLRENLPRRALLELKAFGSSGSVRILKLNNAALARFSGRTVGVMAVMFFAFVGESWSK